MDWKKLFSKKNLDRGYHHFLNGAVERFYVSGQTMIATVNEIEMYEVKIDLKNNIIEKMSCSCPVAEKGKNCEHMAAALYQWEKHKENDGESIVPMGAREKKQEEKRRLKEERHKTIQQQKKTSVYKDNKPVYEYKQPIYKSKNQNAGCWIIAIILLIFYIPIKVIAELTKKYY